MAVFHEDRLPVDIERGALGGPMFKTRVFSLESGFEQRNIDWSQVRGEWDVGYGLMHMEDENVGSHVHAILNFFYARQGRAYGFRFKDWSDYEIGDPSSPSSAGAQDIGLGDDATTDFQIYKRYTSGSENYDRTIKKIVDGTYYVYLDGTLQTETTHYTIDVNTGIITFVTPPASTGGSGGSGEEVVSVECEFDVPVRFDIDHLQINVEQALSGSIPQIPIKELRLKADGTG